MTTHEIDLGGDEGYVKVTVCGNTVTISPSEELDEILKNAEATNRKTGNDFFRVVQERIKAVVAKQCDGAVINPSLYVALAYFEKMGDCDKEIADSFSKRLGLRSISVSTAEPQESATDECAPTSPMSAD